MRPRGLALLALMPLAWTACNAQPQQFAALNKKVADLETRVATLETQLAAANQQLAALKAAPPASAEPTAVARAEDNKLKDLKPATPEAKTVTPAATDGKKPVIQADEVIHDFGVTWVGPPLKHSFTLTNTGEATLQISKVKPSCGCTIAGKYPKKLAPGASGKFPFSLKSEKLHGQYAKSITITSNDPTTPQLKLTLKGEVKWEVSVKPTLASFGTITDTSQPQERVVKLTNNTERGLALKLRPASDGDPFKYELREITPEKEFELHVIAEPPYKGGTLRSSAVLETNFEKQKEIKVTAYARVPERLDVQPPYLTIVLPATKTGAKRRPRQIRFTNNGTEPVKLLSATVDDDAVKTRIEETKPGKAFTIYVEVPPDYSPPPTGRTLTLKTDDKEKPVITIPIRVYDRSKQAAARKPRPRPAESMKGKPVPAFAATTKQGEAVSASSLKDTVTVLNFFAPNCGFCKRQLPVVEKIRNQYADNKNVRFVNISQTMRKKFTDEEVLDTLKGLGARSELVTDGDNKLGKLFKATSYPTMFVVGRDGKIEHVNVGAKRDLDKLLKQQLDGLLKGKPAAKQGEAPKGKPAAAKPAPKSDERKAEGQNVSLPTPVTVTPP